MLLVEDDPFVRATVKLMLQQGGLTVLEARSGPRALEIARANPGVIDVLVADVVMPGMSGLELAQILRHERPETRVIFVSGHTDDPMIRRTLIGRDNFLPKPLSREVLNGLIQRMISGSGTHAEAD